MQYPLFPLIEIKDRLSQYIYDLKFNFIYELKVTSSETEFDEASMQEQANDPAWFKHRKYWFTTYLSTELAIPHQKHQKWLNT